MTEIKGITVKFLDYKDMRYPTVGDYEMVEGDILEFRIAKSGNSIYDRIVLIHEMGEQLMSEFKGVTNEQIDEFDFAYEKNRPEGNMDEPGDDPNCPVQIEHSIMTAVERILCACMNIPWKTYNDAIDNIK